MFGVDGDGAPGARTGADTGHRRGRHIYDVPGTSQNTMSW